MVSLLRKISLYCKGGICRSLARYLTPRRVLLSVLFSTLFLMYNAIGHSGIQLEHSSEHGSAEEHVEYKKALPIISLSKITSSHPLQAEVKRPAGVTRHLSPSSNNRTSSSHDPLRQVAFPKAAATVGGDGVCSYQNTFSLTQTHQIMLDQEPFAKYTSSVLCLANGHMAVYADKFAVLDNVVIDSSKALGDRQGGEDVADVSKQAENKEYLQLAKGFFSIPCDSPPIVKFNNKDHLVKWIKALSCYKDNNSSSSSSSNSTGVVGYPYSKISQIKGTTIAIQRYEYANLYCTMTEFYNTFVMMMITGSDPSHVTNVLLVDAHPKGALDSAWEVLYGRTIRAKHIKGPVVFSKVVWSLLSYFSPLWNTRLTSVPYLEEFRYFFLSRHKVTTDHVANCAKLNAVIIWRRDYVAHPRNPTGVVERKFYNEKEIHKQVEKTLGPEANVTGVQLDNLTMREQIRLISTCDILIAMHGAGLAHVMFLPRTSGFLEMFPAYKPASSSHFQAIGKWRKLKYLVYKNTDRKREMPNKMTNIDLGQLDSHVSKLRSQVCAVKTV